MSTYPPGACYTGLVRTTETLGASSCNEGRQKVVDPGDIRCQSLSRKLILVQSSGTRVRVNLLASSMGGGCCIDVEGYEGYVGVSEATGTAAYIRPRVMAL